MKYFCGLYNHRNSSVLNEVTVMTVAAKAVFWVCTARDTNQSFKSLHHVIRSVDSYKFVRRNKNNI